eukprot:GDKJ01038193.1.p1 GENE.GDKJ01038193.1~~GDKJ01038193.1.p1  ORF type:complete len:264 (-),score=89.59 GDKJ01038193.1:161-952(-)
MIFEVVALAAIALFLFVIFLVYRFVTRDDRLDADKQSFLNEVDSIAAIPAPEEEIRDYDEKREDTFKIINAVKKGWLKAVSTSNDQPPIMPEERLKTLTKNQLEQLDKEFEEATFLKGDWMSGGNLSQNDGRVLKAALFTRALANLPRYELTRSEVLGKMELVKRQMLAENHWGKVSELNQAMVDEINFIKREANLLENGWAEAIFAQAAHIRKQQEENEKKRHMHMLMQARAKAMGASLVEDSSDEDNKKKPAAKAKIQRRK